MQTINNIIPILIREFTNIFETSIAEEIETNADYRKYRFKLACVLLELYAQLGKLPYTRYLNLFRS